jgi:hypothetical protein
VDRVAVSPSREAPVMSPWLVIAYVAGGAPAAPSTGPTGPVFIRPLHADAPPRTPSRLVFAFMPAVSFGVSAVPSLDLPFFFGGRLRGRAWALGYQFTLSGGLAERYVAGFLTHRHHLASMRRFGQDARYLASLGGGVAFLISSPVLEVEGRIAWSFGQRKRGLIGLVGRLGWNVGYGELAPLPQLGLVLGVSTL